jgi:ankyrin repeat protein
MFPHRMLQCYETPENPLSGNNLLNRRGLPTIEKRIRLGENKFVLPSNSKAGNATMKGRILTLGCSLLAMSLIACSSTRTQGNRDLALIRAAEKGETKEVYRLIEAGADVNARDPEGWTPYLAASSMGHLDAMRVLRAFGAKTIAPEREPENVVRYLAN